MEFDEKLTIYAHVAGQTEPEAIRRKLPYVKRGRRAGRTGYQGSPEVKAKARVTRSLEPGAPGYDEKEKNRLSQCRRTWRRTQERKLLEDRIAVAVKISGREEQATLCRQLKDDPAAIALRATLQGN